MKLKTMVGIVLIISLFLAGNIILFGVVSEKAFPYAYFLFLFLGLAWIVWAVRSEQSSPAEVLLGVLLVLVIASSVSLFVTAINSYQAKEDLVNEKVDTLQTEIDNAEKMNQYYTQYGGYLKKELDTARSRTSDLQKKLDQIKKDIETQKNKNSIVAPIIQALPPVQEQVTLPPEYIEEYSYKEYEEEREDEREEEEDDD